MRHLPENSRLGCFALNQEEPIWCKHND